MKTVHKIGIFTLVFFLGLSLKGQENKLANPITLVSFELSHSRRIPNYEVAITISLADTVAAVQVKAKPMLEDKKWAKTAIDTGYTISRREFIEIKNSVLNIAPSDIEKAIIKGRDGTSCSISFGDQTNRVTYTFWSPDAATKERDLERFVAVCKLIIRSARLKEKDVL